MYIMMKVTSWIIELKVTYLSDKDDTQDEGEEVLEGENDDS